MWTSEYTSYEPDSYDDLSHFGVKSTKWEDGIRDRYHKSIDNRSLIYQKRDGLSKEKADKKAKRVVNTAANILFEHKYNNFTVERLSDHEDEINKIARSEKLKVWGQTLAPVAVGGTLVGGLANSHLVKKDSDKIQNETGR